MLMSKDTKYTERHRFWTDKAISQLSLSIEVMFAVAVATLGYILDDDNCCRFCWFSRDCFFSFKLFSLFFSILMIVGSIFYGLLSLFSRNLDLRLTRHITFLIGGYPSPNQTSNPA
jgi:disulfide bond formation protein DsbB